VHDMVIELAEIMYDVYKVGTEKESYMNDSMK